MNTRQLNIAIWATAAVLACGAVAVLAIGLFAPLQSPGADSASGAGAPAASQPASAAMPSMGSLDAVLNRRLRVALTDAPAAAAAAIAPATPAAAASPALVLVGTIGQSLAMIRTADGTVAVKGVGEQVDGADVLAIRPTQIDVRIGGKTVTLEKRVETNDTP
jgi:hypothetical protein